METSQLSSVPNSAINTSLLSMTSPNIRVSEARDVASLEEEAQPYT
jgi:hypothetical protein